MERPRGNVVHFVGLLQSPRNAGTMVEILGDAQPAMQRTLAVGLSDTGAHV